jgi:prepilin-type N-terminal cleavage/methylation domain-containing protein
MRGVTLLELMVTLAIFSLVATMSMVALGPMKDRYTHGQAVERVTEAVVRARLLARETGRCHSLGVYDASGTPKATGSPGARLRILRRPNAHCSDGPGASAEEHVEWVDMPEGVTVTVAAVPANMKLEWRPTGRLWTNGTSIGDVRLEVKGRNAPTMDILVMHQGPVCAGLPGLSCP